MKIIHSKRIMRVKFLIYSIFMVVVVIVNLITEALAK